MRKLLILGALLLIACSERTFTYDRVDIESDAGWIATLDGDTFERSRDWSEYVPNRPGSIYSVTNLDTFGFVRVSLKRQTIEHRDVLFFESEEAGPWRVIATDYAEGTEQTARIKSP